MATPHVNMHKASKMDKVCIDKPPRTVQCTANPEAGIRIIERLHAHSTSYY